MPSTWSSLVELFGTIASTPQQYWDVVINGRTIWHDNSPCGVALKVGRELPITQKPAPIFVLVD
jgi:hypothetical protein